MPAATRSPPWLWNACPLTWPTRPRSSPPLVSEPEEETLPDPEPGPSGAETWLALLDGRLSHAGLVAQTDAMSPDLEKVVAGLLWSLAALYQTRRKLLLVFTLLGSAFAKRTITAVAVLSVALSWAAVQATFTLRYARLYYGEGGGVDFNEESIPDYRDFAYWR